MVVAPGSDSPAANGDMRLTVLFRMGTRVVMLASSIMPQDSQLGPAEFMVNIERSSDTTQGLGLSLEHSKDGCTLIIKSISSGLIEEWNNRSSADMVVHAGDRLVEVNG